MKNASKNISLAGVRSLGALIQIQIGGDYLIIRYYYVAVLSYNISQTEFVCSISNKHAVDTVL